VRSDLRAHHAGAEYGYLANDQIAHVVPPGELCGVANVGWRFVRVRTGFAMHGWRQRHAFQARLTLP
jgi:hypothetical protein